MVSASRDWSSAIREGLAAHLIVFGPNGPNSDCNCSFLHYLQMFVEFSDLFKRNSLSEAYAYEAGGFLFFLCFFLLHLIQCISFWRKRQCWKDFVLVLVGGGGWSIRFSSFTLTMFASFLVVIEVIRSCARKTEKLAKT